LSKWKVIGLDAMTDYYDVNLKKGRLKLLLENTNFYSYMGLIQDPKLLDEICSRHNPKIIIHLAAQAGVRYSIENPISYVESNLIGTFHILEMAKKYKPDHLLMASTSSVYGSNKEMPMQENQKCDTPMSFYAATKKSNEAMAHSYSHLYNIPITMFRFFTVYGPWGRPDMALFKFTKNILLDKPIDVYNKGNMMRDFTYIDDLVKAISLLTHKIPQIVNKRKQGIKNDSISDIAPFRIVNIGNSQPINLLDYINELERVLGKVAFKNFLGMQDGDVYKTHSNIELLEALTGFRPKTTLHEGISEFVKWYKSYYL
jgi:UDP-glucuronate 4-epimerase